MNGIQEVSGSIPLISTKREPGEPNADNYDGRRGVCPGLSIGVTDGQIRIKPLGNPGGFILFGKFRYIRCIFFILTYEIFANLLILYQLFWDAQIFSINIVSQKLQKYKHIFWMQTCWAKIPKNATGFRNKRNITPPVTAPAPHNPSAVYQRLRSAVR